MTAAVVPQDLRKRLGDDASEGLVAMFKAYDQLAAERFERQLTAEMAGLRLDMHGGFMTLRQDMADTRVEWLKWSFLFWVGQLAAVAGLLAFMLRGR